MAKKSRVKGQRNECALVNTLKDAGLPAVRVPLSGMHGGQFAGDLLVDGERYEAKVRSTGFRQIYSWLGDNAGLFIRSDRNEALIVLRVEDWIALKTRGKPGA
jgi:Holliday junction resolvase